MGVAWEEAYDARFQGSAFGTDAIGLFAIGLQFGIEDLDAVGAESILGGPNDKKCDLVYFDPEEGRCVLAQCYVSQKSKSGAPSNKASDLNTAVTWLINTPIDSVPDRLRTAAAEVREAARNDTLRGLYIWFVHNVPESKNVAQEMAAVEHAALAAVRQLNGNSSARIIARELGAQSFARLYRESESPILVTGPIEFSVSAGFPLKGEEWSAYQTMVPGRSLYQLYKKYRTDLFSANIRDYLGSRASDSNINNGIKHTAERDPDNFWAFNNGIAALVNGLRVKKVKKEFQL
jgi:hypothetical protein